MYVENVSLYQVRQDATVPTYGSEFSACFDLYACIRGEIKIWYEDNFSEKIQPQNNGLIINPGDRVLIPTGFVFCMGADKSMRIHPRSGLATKFGIIVANCEGVVDCDYPEETFVLLTNISSVSVGVMHGDRIAQGEIVDRVQVRFGLVEKNMAITSSRVSGCGSTGK
jgi:dUTP pyrophosphatase